MYHDLWINPESSDHLVLGNDGGVYFSYDRGATWDFLNQMAIGQFYAIDVDMREPYYIYGGVQDYCSWAGPSATRNTIGITESDWYKVMTGDGFQVRIDPHDHNILYAEAQTAWLPSAYVQGWNRYHVPVASSPSTSITGLRTI